MKNLGTLGDVGFFSLGRGKAFSTVEGGIILTNNNSIARSLKLRLTNRTPAFNKKRLSITYIATHCAIPLRKTLVS